MGSTDPQDEIAKLIELATAPSVPGENLELNEAERFVVSKGIKIGSERITPFHIWCTYIQWTEKPMNKIEFAKQFKKLFKQYREEKRRYYLLDPAPFDMSLDNLWKMRAEIRRLRAGRRKYGSLKKEKEAIETQQDETRGPGQGIES